MAYDKKDWKNEGSAFIKDFEEPDKSSKKSSKKVKDQEVEE